MTKNDWLEGYCDALSLFVAEYRERGLEAALGEDMLESLYEISGDMSEEAMEGYGFAFQHVRRPLREGVDPEDMGNLGQWIEKHVEKENEADAMALQLWRKFLGLSK